MSRQMWKDAYNVIKAMLQYDEMDIPKIWTMAGECLRQLSQLKEAKDFLEQGMVWILMMGNPFFSFWRNI